MGLLKTLFAPRDLSRSPSPPKERSSSTSPDQLAQRVERTHLWEGCAHNKQSISTNDYHASSLTAPSESTVTSFRPDLMQENPPKPQMQVRLTSPITKSPSPAKLVTPTKPYSYRQSMTPEPVRSRTSSPALSSSSPKPNQCHGTTTQGKRCTRTVASHIKTKSPVKRGSAASPTRPVLGDISNSSITDLDDSSFVQLNRMLSRRRQRRQHDASPTRSGLQSKPINLVDESDLTDEEEEEEAGKLELPVFCHQHAKQAMEEKGTFAGSKGVWIVYDEWIPASLPRETKLQLRHEMAKPASAHEAHGYIYVHELAGSSRKADINGPHTTFVKIGRSVKPIARLAQWRKQCPSRQIIVRDFFPLHVSHPLLRRQTPYKYLTTAAAPTTHPSEGSRLSGALLVADVGAPFNHRWERLVLIEAAGRVAIDNAAREQRYGTLASARGQCADCGQTHVELFQVEIGAYEDWIVDCILRWQMFVEKVLDA